MAAMGFPAQSGTLHIVLLLADIITLYRGRRWSSGSSPSTPRSAPIWCPSGRIQAIVLHRDRRGGGALCWVVLPIWVAPLSLWSGRRRGVGGLQQQLDAKWPGDSRYTELEVDGAIFTDGPLWPGSASMWALDVGH